MKSLLTTLIIVLSIFIAELSGQQYKTLTRDDFAYVKVDSVLGADTVRITNSSFSVDSGDVVMLIQHKGAKLIFDPPPNGATVDDLYNAGNFEFLVVSKKVGNLVIFTKEFLRPNSFDYNESLQLVKVPYGDYLKVSSGISLPSWNGDTGGVFAVIALKRFVLDNNIDLSGKGYKGAEPDNTYDYTGSCNAENIDYYHTDSIHKAALKGESYITNSFKYNRGKGRVGIGGGGGNGKFSGGGGGSNYYPVDDPFDAGFGGIQADECATGLITQGAAHNGKPAYIYKAFFGGGGGTSMQNKPSNLATAGGSGGGIIIVIADTLESNAAALIVNGENVTGSATSGAGGGGGGGSICLAVDNYIGNLTLSAEGGDGGNTSAAFCTGAGGGGSGGIVWHSGASLPGNVTATLTGGVAGSPAIGGCYFAFDGTPGDDGDIATELRAPLNGLLFNAIHDNDTICQGQTPRNLVGTNPKGGDGPGTYVTSWEYKTSSGSWTDLSHTDKDYQPPALFETTSYRRIVTSGSTSDTSRAVEIFVWDSIAGNQLLSADTTYCLGTSAKTLNARSVTGGNGSYNYVWEGKTNSGSWDTVQITATDTTYNPGILAETYLFRLVVTSAKVCRDTTKEITLEIQQALTNFELLPLSQYACFGDRPDTLKGESGLSGGDEVTYNFAWGVSDDLSVWKDTSMGVYTNPLRYPEIPSDTVYYRRIVWSGACRDTSMPATVLVIDTIQNNMVGNVDTICFQEAAPLINSKAVVAGGDYTMPYLFTWQKSENLTDWSNTAVSDQENLDPGILDTTTYYRRVIQSQTCFDTSNIIKITVVPEIINTLVTNGDTICFNDAHSILTGNTATGGFGGISYQWESRTTSGSWMATGETGVSHPAKTLTESMYYKRKASSDICSDYTDSILVKVYPLITNNALSKTIDSICFNTDYSLDASTPENGNSGDYAYQWQINESGTWQNEVSQTAEDIVELTVNSVKDTVYYRRMVSSPSISPVCFDNSDSILVKVLTLPTASIPVWDTAVCDEQVISIPVNLSGKSPWTITLSRGDVYNIQNTQAGLNVGYENTDSYVEDTLILTIVSDANNCLAVSKTGSIKIISYENPMPSLENIVDVCGDTGVFEVINAKFSGKWLSDNLTFKDSIDPSTEAYIIKKDSSFHVVWKEDNNGCAYSDTAEVVFYSHPQLPVSSLDTTLYNQKEFLMEFKIPHNYKGLWSVDDGDVTLSGATDSSVVLHFTKLREDNPVIISYDVQNGECDQLFDFKALNKYIFVPNGFSPDGDNINEYFYIEGLDDEATKEIVILNKWGNVIFQSSDYDRNKVETLWNGQDTKGNKVPTGTYYYVLKVGANEILTGFVELRRNGGN